MKYVFDGSLLVMPELDYDNAQPAWHAPFAMKVYKHTLVEGHNDGLVYCEGCGAGNDQVEKMFWVEPQHASAIVDHEPTLAHCYDCLEGIYETVQTAPWDIMGSLPLMLCPPPVFMQVKVNA